MYSKYDHDSIECKDKYASLGHADSKYYLYNWNMYHLFCIIVKRVIHLKLVVKYRTFVNYNILVDLFLDTAGMICQVL